MLQSTFLLCAKEYVNEIMIPLENHYYHQYGHALEVMNRAMYLAQKEWLNHEEKEMLGIAALFHDTWFLIQYENNEIYGAKIARNFLTSIFYPEDKIEKIWEIILATDPDYLHPKNIYEKIIKDADLDNLGRDDFFEHGDKLKKELEAIKHIKILDPDWQHGSIQFLKAHKYYTQTQQKERGEKKQLNQKILEDMLKELHKKESYTSKK